MHLQHAQAALPATRYAVCDPQGRPLHATFGSSPTQSQELFSRQFDVPWRMAEEDGYEVFEVSSNASPSLQ